MSGFEFDLDGFLNELANSKPEVTPATPEETRDYLVKSYLTALEEMKARGNPGDMTGAMSLRKRHSQR